MSYQILHGLNGDYLERLEERFWSKVDKAGPDECWLWTGALNNKGYGCVGVNGAHSKCSHRVSYELLVGPIPEDKHVLHRCDVPNCVNPSHLFLGTQTDNMQDAARKGRTRGAQGEQHWRSKLTQEIADEIRHRYTTEKITLNKLGEQYGVTGSTVWYILKRRIWNYSGGPSSKDCDPGNG